MYTDALLSILYTKRNISTVGLDMYDITFNNNIDESLIYDVLLFKYFIDHLPILDIFT